MTEYRCFEWDGSKPIKCRYCEHGWRHFVGNCVLCGWGPAPGALSRNPKDELEYAEALASVGIMGVDAETIIQKIVMEGNQKTQAARDEIQRREEREKAERKKEKRRNVHKSLAKAIRL